MTEEKPVEAEADEAPKKRSAFIGKLLANKSYILHSLLVFILFGFFAWQILDFYLLSTDYNRSRAVKTSHMVIYDIENGTKLANLPSSVQEEEEVIEDTHTTEDEVPAAQEVPQPEVVVIVSGIGKDPAYSAEATALPPEFIFSYSPYGSQPLEASKNKVAKGAAVMAEIQYADGKFDISAKNTDFRNANNAAAGISKIYGASAVYIAAPESYTGSPAFEYLAAKLQEKHIIAVIPQAYKGSSHNVISADVIIKAVTPAEEVNAQLAKLEEAAKADGYAVAVVEPQVNIAPILADWAATLEAKKIKLIPVIKN